MHRFSEFWHMRLPHRLQGQKVKSQSHGAGAYCGGHPVADPGFSKGVAGVELRRRED